MTVICEYCESVVEVTGNHNCPFCGATLRDPILKEAQRIRAEQDELEKKQELKEKEREQQEENERILNFALSLLGGSSGKSLLRRAARNAIKKNL
ncbi:MAG: hypothetical protein IKH13_07450 [Clostridia bacterium]|nr:hypothetical protein [Clostridia bacterium]